MEDQARGQEIMQAVFKASMQALFAIGVKSSDNVDKFTLHFSNALDKEFLKIGLLPNQVDQIEAQDSTSFGQDDTALSPGPNINTGADEATVGEVKKGYYPDLTPVLAIENLKLKPLVAYHLKKAGITTIDELMTRMQQVALTSIKGIKEKSAKQILEALATWQKSA